MGWFKRWMRQTATYWAPTGPGPGPTVESTYAAPVAITCRWILKQDKFVSTEGRDEVSSAVVWTEEEVVLKGYLFLGTSTSTTPANVASAFLIRRIREVTSTDGSKTARKAML